MQATLANVIAVGTLAPITLLAVPAQATTDPGGGGGGCYAYMGDVRKTGTTVTGTFKVGCDKVVWKIAVQGNIDPSWRKPVWKGKECYDVKVCAVTVAVANDPAGSQKYQFVFEPDGAVTSVSYTKLSQPALYCYELGCGFANMTASY